MRFCTVSACLHVHRPQNLPRRLSGCGRRSGFRIGPVSLTPRWPAWAECGRSGLAGADVAAIAATAGVARGTFYFHFPTKEHVLVELERAEEAKIVATLDTRTAAPDDLLSLLRLLVRHVLAAQERLGPKVFRDMLGLHFSATRPVEHELDKHPLAGFLIAAIADAQAAGRVSRKADPGDLGVIFLTGLFALLATGATASVDRYAL